MGNRRSNRKSNRCTYCGSTAPRGAGICRPCAARPKAENILRRRAKLAFETLCGFLVQKNISAGNIQTIHSMDDIEDERFRSFLFLVQEIARLHPRKRRRWKWLHKNEPELMDHIRQHDSFDWLLDLCEDEGGWYPDDADSTSECIDEEDVSGRFPLGEQPLKVCSAGGRQVTISHVNHVVFVK